MDLKPTVSNNQLVVKNQHYQTPLFFPDATLGVVRSLSSIELKLLGLEGIVINTYHLKDHPGTEVLQKLGGVKQLMNWSGLAASDSGGFQLFSLIQKNPKLGKITDQGVTLYSGEKQRKKTLFTPEKSIQIQFAIGADIMVCLDDFTPHTFGEAAQKRVEQSVSRTIAWSKRSKAEFQRQIEKRGLSENNRPLLLAPIQGQRHWQLRQECAQELTKIGFDGYGLGGWPFDQQGKFDYQLSQFNAQLTPDDRFRFALGVGMPENIVELFKMGYHIFDCVLPTRDARHQRLYVYQQDPTEIDFLSETNQQAQPDWYQFVYIDRGRFKTDQKPISPYCDCYTCQHHSRAYLNHLFKVKDALAIRLATTHNLRFYSRLVQELQKINSKQSKKPL
ncbi:MAG: tRNA-guanine transglycosylase [Candidatus Pacebacteria bacterium]|nr:tRNA-guanine transglycosylase [Candidatus Paceibacterota bacterium]